MFTGDSIKSGGQPQVPPVIQYQKSFKRNVNSATKENNVRTTSRPASAQPKVSNDNGELTILIFMLSCIKEYPS